MSYSTQEILDSKIKRGRVFLEKLEKASLNGFEENKKLLFKLIEENKNKIKSYISETTEINKNIG